MKKAAAIAGVVFTVLALCAGMVSAGRASAVTQSAASSATLQAKIDKIKKAETEKNRRVTERLDVSEKELESYVLVSMKKDIPVKMDSIRVVLTPGTIAADSRLTIPPVSTGNFIVDALVSGTHDIL